MPAGDDWRSGYPWAFFDAPSRHGVMLVRRTDDLPPWTPGSPLVLLLHLAFACRGWRLLHAGALGSGDVGVLLAGPSGAGKSGTTLAGITRGLMTAGDDYLLVEPGASGASPVAWPLYRFLKQDAAGLLRVGREGLAQGPVNWSGKFELDLEGNFPGRMVQSLPLKAILLLRPTGGPRSSLRPAAPTQAFSQIAASMLRQLPGARLAGFSFLTRLTRSLPAYHLDLGLDPQEIADTVASVLAS
jgi:hypothetical protein